MGVWILWGSLLPDCPLIRLQIFIWRSDTEPVSRKRVRKKRECAFMGDADFVLSFVLHYETKLDCYPCFALNQDPGVSAICSLALRDLTEIMSWYAIRDMIIVPLKTFPISMHKVRLFFFWRTHFTSCFLQCHLKVMFALLYFDAHFEMLP